MAFLLGVLVCTFAAPATAGLVIAPIHFVFADTSVSNNSRQDVTPVDGVTFDSGALAGGADAQGRISAGLAAQSVLFEARHGASGSGEVALELSEGATGTAISRLVALFDIGSRSSFTLSALFSATGNILPGAELSLTLLADSGSVEDFVDIFRFDTTPRVVDVAGLLDPGVYRFIIDTRVDVIEPGSSQAGFGRFDFDFRFDDVRGGGGGSVPEPSTVALVLVSAGATVNRWRRRESAGRALAA